MRTLRRRAVTVLLSVFVCSAALASLWAPLDETRTEERNRDGRPDLWRSHAGDGRILTVAVDTNFDGRSDVEEFYEEAMRCADDATAHPRRTYEKTVAVRTGRSLWAGTY